MFFNQAYGLEETSLTSLSQVNVERKRRNKMEYNTLEDVFVIVLIILIGSSILAGFFKKKDDSKEK